MPDYCPADRGLAIIGQHENSRFWNLLSNGYEPVQRASTDLTMSAEQTSPDTQHLQTRPRRLDWKLVVIPILIVATLLAAGLAVRSRLASSTSISGVEGATTAPAFTVATVNGPRFSLAAQHGRPVVLFFMAAWCTSCLIESNALGEIQRHYGNNVRTVLVDIGRGDSPSALRNFVQRSQGPSRYWVLDSDGVLALRYGVQSLDTTYVIDKGGRIVYSDKLPVDYTELNRVVRRVV